MARKPKPTTTNPLFAAKLASSGLSVDDGAALGMKFLTPEQTMSYGRSLKAQASMLIPYFQADGQPLTVRPHHPPFWRLRYLGQATDFAAVAETKPRRYAQASGTGVGAYLPKLPSVDWPSLLADPSAALLITEGELKAAKSTKDGYPCIGLGGVWNYKSAKTGVTFLPELEAINWVRRNVYIVYDSDFRDKEGVVMALNALAEELTERGAIPFVVTLPELAEEDGGKTGLDDFLIHPSGGPEQLALLLHEAQPLTLARPLWLLNDQVVYVKNPGLLVEQATDNKLSPSQFKEHAYSTARFAEQVFKSDGTVSLKRLPAALTWLQWPHRQSVNQLTYRPGHEKFCLDEDTSQTAYNTWAGWGCEPVKGDTAPWHELVQHLFSEAEPEAVKWFLDWCAYPLQYPGTKLFSAVVVHGIHEGTGKSLLGYTLGDIYGKNFMEIRQDDLHSGSNDWAENKQFVLGDEVTGSDNRKDADTLKKLITQKDMRIDIKYVPTYSLKDRINYYFTSNQPGAFFLSDKDRRYFINEVVNGPLSEDFYADYDLWRHGRGPSHLFHELLHRDLGGFNPAAPAFMTSAKQRMMEDVRSDLASWVRQLILEPQRFMRFGQVAMERDLVTNKDLLRLYDLDGSKRVTANGLGRELRRAGVPLANKGNPLKTSLGFERLYIVRNLSKWANAPAKDLIKHVDEAEAQFVKLRG